MKYLSILLVFLLTTSCEEIIEVGNISDKSITVLAPQDNTEVQTGNIVFSWQELQDATAYNIQVATPNFTDATQIVLDTTVTTFNFSKTLPEGNYEWRIKAKNEEYETAYITKNFSVIP